jgi:hypothetical protein
MNIHMWLTGIQKYLTGNATTQVFLTGISKYPICKHGSLVSGRIQDYLTGKQEYPGVDARNTQVSRKKHAHPDFVERSTQVFRNC